MYIKVIGKEMEEFRGKAVILFGCGSSGLRAVEEFEKVGAHIVGFCDNNEAMVGKNINGYKIFDANYLKHNPDIHIVITSTYEDEIDKQLRDLECKNIHRIKLGVLKETLPVEKFRNKVLTIEEANQYLFDGLTGDTPFFVGRLGSVELECLSHYLYFLDRRASRELSYPDNVKMMMNINAGFFPPDDDLLDEFCLLYLKGLSEMDIIWSMWFSKYEDMIYNDHLKHKLLAEYDTTALPISFENPWTQALKGKKVLVIHPFCESIQENYRLNKILFTDPNFIPEFELITLKAVQSIAGNQTEYATWFAALKDMEQQMDQIDFDIALIGAGAYGLPLGAYAKELGKKAIHVGGYLQLYFGIKGRAFDKIGIYNENWSSPKESEIPKHYKKVEAGRYW